MNNMGMNDVLLVAHHSMGRAAAFENFPSPLLGDTLILNVKDRLFLPNVLQLLSNVHQLMNCGFNLNFK